MDSHRFCNVSCDSMIPDLIISVFSIFLSAIFAVLGIIDFVIPVGIEQGTVTVIGYLYTFQGVFPVDTLITAITTLGTLLFFWYVVKIAMWVYSLIPLSGTKQELPKSHKK